MFILEILGADLLTVPYKGTKTHGVRSRKKQKRLPATCHPGSDSAPRTSTKRDKRLEVIPEEVLPRAREDKRAPDSPRKVDREVEETSRESDKARQAPNTQRTPWKGPFVCVFCLEKGDTQADHYCHGLTAMSGTSGFLCLLISYLCFR